METGSQIHLFPKLEQPNIQQLEWMLMDDHLQRSLHVPLLAPPPSLDTNYWTYDSSTKPPVQHSPSLPPQSNFNFTNNNELFNQNIENNFLLGGADFDLWNKCPPLCEDAWIPNFSEIFPSTPCTFENPKPMITTTSFDQNEPFFLAKNTDNFNSYYFNNHNNQGLISMEPMQGNYNMLEGENSSMVMETKPIASVKVPKIELIGYEEIRKYFDMPISSAAKALNVGLTVLKKRCRDLNIKRWPHRKIKSLEGLISNLKEMGMTKDMVDELEELKRKLHFMPGLQLTAETKRLRQACFKANYKKRRAAARASLNQTSVELG